VRRIRLSPKAQEDILEAADYTLRIWGEEQMNRYVDGLNDRFVDLAEAPRQFPLRNDAGRGLRSARYRAHIVFFRETKKEVRIVRVLHHKRDYRRHLDIEDDLG